MSLPKQIRLNEAQVFPVVEKRLTGCKLGYFDRSTGTIAIEADQPEPGKHVILLHELLHFVAEILVQQGIIKRQPDESFVTHAAPVLLGLLAQSGLYNAIRAQELLEFMRKHMPAGSTDQPSTDQR